MGLRVIVDDMLKPTVNAGGADQYPVYLMGGGSVAEGVQRAFFTEADRNILSKQDVMSWTHDLRLPRLWHFLEERQRQPRQHCSGYCWQLGMRLWRSRYWQRRRRPSSSPLRS